MGCGASKLNPVVSEPSPVVNRGRKQLAEGEPACEQVVLSAMQKRYNKGKFLGRGAFGECHEAVDLLTDQEVCVKSVFKNNKKFKANMLDAEVRIMFGIEHPGVVQLYTAHETDDVAFLIFELVKGGDLLQRCIDYGRVSDGKTARVCHQLFSALAYLHERGICHRDVKPENVMMVTDDPDDPRYWEVQLTDFGLSCMKEDVFDNVMKTLHGTPEFAAPELLKISRDRSLRGKACYSCKVDIWATGVVAYTMLSSKNPFNRHGNLPGMIAKIIVGDYHFNGRSWTGTSPVAIEFVQHLMQVDPDARQHATEVLKHPFMQTIERSDSGAESGYSAADTRMAEVASYAGSYISSASSHKLGRFAPQCDSEFQFGSMRSVTSLISSPKGKQAAGSGPLFLQNGGGIKAHFSANGNFSKSALQFSKTGSASSRESTSPERAFDSRTASVPKPFAMTTGGEGAESPITPKSSSRTESCPVRQIQGPGLKV